jgi:membrane fusion protein (multidrug efflux system)
MQAIIWLNNVVKSRTAVKSVAVVTAAALLGAAGYWYLDYEAAHPSTRDAYTNAHVVRIAAQVSGPVISVPISNHQRVRAGDLLFAIDPQPFQIALDQAEAALALTGKSVAAAGAAVVAAQAAVRQRQAAYDDASVNARRIEALVARGMMPAQAGDDAEAQLKEARATLDAAKSDLKRAIEQRGELGRGNAQTRLALAKVAQARLDLSHTQIRAPIDGAIAELELRPGSTVDAGVTLFALVDEDRWWVDANFRETDLVRIKPGQPATVRIDMYPGVDFAGVVDSVSPASGAAFSLLPPENATGNWVKVTQRFPVKIVLRDIGPTRPLRIGASSTVSIDTTVVPEQRP